MTIKFNEMTWYSKLLAVIILLILVPVLTFYIGMKYQEAKMVRLSPGVVPQTPSDLRTIVTLEKKYINTKHGFEFDYPADWKVTTPGPGEWGMADDKASVIEVSNQDNSQGFTIAVIKLGSDKISAFNSPAKNVQEHIKNSFSVTDLYGNVLRRFVKEITLAGYPAYWYETNGWYARKQSYEWIPGIYFQRGDDVFEINEVNPESHDTPHQILMSLKVGS